MKYITPEVELMILMANDVITASQGGNQGGNQGGVTEGGGIIGGDDEL